MTALALAALWGTLGIANADSGTVGSNSSDDTAAAAEWLRSGMTAERQRLRQCAFRARGLEKIEEVVGSDSVPIVECKGDIFGAFDFDAGRTRFDRKRPEPAIVAGGPANARWERIEEKFISRENATVFFNSQFNRVEVRPKGFTHRELRSMPRTQGYFDVRNLGLLKPAQLFNGISLEQEMAGFWKQVPDEVAVDDGEVYRVTWITDETIRRTLSIDSRHGYTPVRLHLQERVSKDSEWLPPSTAISVTWSSLAGVWVPVEYDSYRKKKEPTAGRPGGKQSDKYTVTRIRYTIRWESINQKLDDRRFDYNDFVLPADVRVWDMRPTKPVLLEVTGRKKIGQLSQAADRRLAAAHGSESGRLRDTVFVANGVAIAAVGLWLCVRRWRKRHGEA